MNKEMSMVGLKMSPTIHPSHFILYYLSHIPHLPLLLNTVHTNACTCGSLPPLGLLQGKKGWNLKGSIVFRQIASMEHPDFQPEVFCQQCCCSAARFCQLLLALN